MLTKRKFLPIYLVLFALLVSVAIGSVAVSAQGPSTINTPTATATVPPATRTAAAVLTAAAVTNTVTTTVPTATKPAATTTSAAATATRTATTVPITATAVATATKPSIVATVTRTPTKAASPTITRTPTKVAVKGPKSLTSGPTGTYASTIACVNMGASAATLSLTFYPSDNGTAALSYTDPSTVAAGASRIYFTPSSPPGLPNPFVGSAVVSSDQQMACSTNIQRNDGGLGTTGTPERIATNEGFASGQTSAVMFVPQLEKNFSSSGWNSYLAVQNTESSPITVTVSYTDRFGVAYPSATESISIPAQSNHVFYQADNAFLPDNLIAGAMISGTGKMAAIAALFNGAATYTSTQFLSYSAFPSGANKLLVPRFLRNFHAFQSGLAIQNVGSSSTTVTITFSFAGNTYVVNAGAISPGASLTKYAPIIPELAPVDSLVQSQRFGSAVIQAAPGGLIIANINEDNRGLSNCNGVSGCTFDSANQEGWAASYGAIPDGSQTNTFYIAQLMNHVGSPDYSGGFQITNTTSNAGTCNISYSGAPAANEASVSLPANGAISRFAPIIPSLPSGFNNSVVVTCTQPVIGIYNYSARSSTYYGDSEGTGEAVNQ